MKKGFLFFSFFSLEIWGRSSRFAENSRTTRKNTLRSKLDLNFKAMVNMIIKKAQKDRVYGNSTLFVVLNKGTNSGKPQKNKLCRTGLS
jgi:hypothetical protein